MGSCEFWASYDRNYHRLVYGDEFYCHREINYDQIVANLSQNIIAQNDALSLFKASFRLANKEKYINIIMSGSLGTGKSLTLSTIAKSFYWKKNVHTFNSENLYALIENVRYKLSKCGFHLILVDDLKKDHLADVYEIESNIREFSLQHNFRVVIIFSFNQELENNDGLENFVHIEYEKFTYENYVKCIDFHLKYLNITIEADEIEELKKLDYKTTGCKSIVKRLNLIKKL
jgi:predicted AAA+ superfamily ATPase